jgi:hypothetical protein
MNNSLEIAFRKAVQDGTKKDKDFIKECMFGKKNEVGKIVMPQKASKSKKNES